MEPIISPWIFYAIDTVHSLSVGCGCIIAIIFVIILSLCANLEAPNVPLKRLYVLIGVLISLILIEVFIPSEKTMYKMLEASYCTQTNIEAAGGDIDAVLDKIESRAKAMK